LTGIIVNPVLLSFFFGLIINPITTEIAVAIGILIVLLTLSALISGSETAFFSLSPADLNTIKGNNSGGSGRIIRLLSKPKELIATILIANNFVNVALIILSAWVLQRLIDFSGHETLAFIIQAIVITSLLLLMGEVMPKIYSSYNSLKFSRFISGLILFFVFVFKPLSYILVMTSSLIDKRLAKRGHNISMPELSKAIELTSASGEHDEEQQILKGIVNFGDIEVSEIMKSRMDIAAASDDTNFDDLMTFVLESGYSRIPVYKDSLDNITGILYIKDLLPVMEQSGDFKWLQLLRPAFFVPENKKISDLLGEFKQKKIHMAIIVDEYGGTTGLITLEDILEEIVGEIMDESDEHESELLYTRIDDNNYIFEGKTSLNDFCKILEAKESDFDEVRGEADSLAGLLLELEGEIPVKNQEIKFNNFVFTIESADKRRIKLIKVTINHE